MELRLEPAEITESGDVWYEVGGTRVMLYPSQFAGPNQATAVNLRVDDVEAGVTELKARGAVFEGYDFGEAFRTVDGICSVLGPRISWVNARQSARYVRDKRPSLSSRYR